MVMRFTSQRKTKAQRGQERRGSPLRVIKPSTLARYTLAVTIFFDWFRTLNQRYPDDPFGLDSLASQFVMYMYENGDAVGTVGDALSGLQHFLPPLRRMLNGSWRLFHAWKAHELLAQAPPFPALVLWGLVGLALCLQMDGLAATMALGLHRGASSLS